MLLVRVLFAVASYVSRAAAGVLLFVFGAMYGADKADLMTLDLASHTFLREQLGPAAAIAVVTAVLTTVGFWWTKSGRPAKGAGSSSGTPYRGKRW